MVAIVKIDDNLLDRAANLTGIRDKAMLVRLGLEILISVKSAHKLAKLGGSEPELRSIHGRKTP